MPPDGYAPTDEGQQRDRRSRRDGDGPASGRGPRNGPQHCRPLTLCGSVRSMSGVRLSISSGPGDQLFEELARATHDQGVLGLHLCLWDGVGEVLPGCLHADDRYAVLGANRTLRQGEPDRLLWRRHPDDRVAVLELDVVLQPAVDQVRQPAPRVNLGPDDVLDPDSLQDAGVFEADSLGPD